MSYPHHHYPDHLLLKNHHHRSTTTTTTPISYCTAIANVVRLLCCSLSTNVIIVTIIILFPFVMVEWADCSKIPLPVLPDPSPSYASSSSYSASSSALSAQSSSDLSSTASISSLSSSHHHHHPNRQLQLIHQKQQQNSYYPTIAQHRMIMQDQAILHLNLMNTLGTCREPRPVVIYPTFSPNKAYFPRGTLLYRCNDQVGCCAHAGEVCRPASIESIERAFFVNHFVVGQKISGHKITPRLKPARHNFTTVIESITFVNHTLCGCVKLAPDAIEHDEQQSVISRPLVVPLTATFGSSSSFMFHLIGTVAMVALVLMLFFLYKCVLFR